MSAVPRLSTSTITTIIARGYVRRNGKVLEPTELGRLTTKLMKDSFPEIVDYGFTAKMEDDLDKIENGQAEYLSVLRNFYTDFEKELKDADEKLEKVEYVKPVEVTDIICDKCGANMVVREGRYGKFAACPNFPKCRNTRRLSDDGDEGAEEVLADESARYAERYDPQKGRLRQLLCLPELSRLQDDQAVLQGYRRRLSAMRQAYPRQTEPQSQNLLFM